MSFLKQTSTMLVIDDDPAIVRLLESVITRSMGDSVDLESLTDPAAARKRIDDGGVDIILTDLDMPGITGLDLLRSAKKRNACTQILLLTGQSTQEALLEAIEFGAIDYLLKPVNHEELMMVVEQAHQRRLRWQKVLALTWKQKKEKQAIACGKLTAKPARSVATLSLANFAGRQNSRESIKPTSPLATMILLADLSASPPLAPQQ